MQELEKVAGILGPLPHASLHIDQLPLTGVGPSHAVPIDVPPKQRARMLKAECQPGCAYVVRVAETPAREIGPPHCPKHGEMKVHWPAPDQSAA